MTRDRKEGKFYGDGAEHLNQTWACIGCSIYSFLYILTRQEELS